MKTILGDRLLIQPIFRIEYTPSASVIFVPEASREKPADAEILQIGNGETPRGKALLSELHVGDTIRWDTRRHGVKLKDDNRMIISVLDVMLVYGRRESTSEPAAP